MKAIYVKNLPSLDVSSFHTLSIENITKNFSDFECFEFTDYDNFMKKVHSFLNSLDVEVETCYYTNTYFIQTLCSNHKNNEKIFVKRKMKENENYTFCSKDIEFLNLLPSDIVHYLRHLYIHKGVHIICDTNELKEIEILPVFSQNDFIDKLLVNENNTVKEIPFINVASVYNKYNGNQEKAQQFLSQYQNTQMIKFLYSQYDNKFCIIDCFYEINGVKKNTHLSTLFHNEILGDAFISLTDINYDNKQFDLSIDTFNQIIKAADSQSFLLHFHKSEGFYYNIFYELDNYI